MISAGQNTAFSMNKTLNIQGRLLSLHTPLVMGILNVTPDSFYDGGRYADLSQVLVRANEMLHDGAAILDVGGYSTRPGAAEIPEDEERKRVIPVIKALRAQYPESIISIDTFRSSIARLALDSGADLVNDVSGGELDPTLIPTVASYKVPYICMHMRGTPQTMASLGHYDNVLYEVIEYFHKKIDYLYSSGITDIIIDPGFGFAKTSEHNFRLLESLDHFQILNKPVLAGLSRKSMIWRTLGITAEEALNGTTALNMVALMKGASLLRVHDVREAVQLIKLFTNLPAAADRV
jgi:dihydropteroate synthase